MRARANILEQIRHLEAKIRSIARQNSVVRRRISVSGVAVITVLVWPQLLMTRHGSNDYPAPEHTLV
jgi:branched-subunit amino acid transport protein